MEYQDFQSALSSDDSLFTVNGILYRKVDTPGVGYMRIQGNYVYNVDEKKYSLDIPYPDDVQILRSNLQNGREVYLSGLWKDDTIPLSLLIYDADSTLPHDGGIVIDPRAPFPEDFSELSAYLSHVATSPGRWIRQVHTFIYPEWWGAKSVSGWDDSLAFQSAVDSACTPIQLGKKTYRLGSTVKISKDGVRIQGKNRHETRITSTAITNGQYGSLLVDANDVVLSDFTMCHREVPLQGEEGFENMYTYEDGTYRLADGIATSFNPSGSDIPRHQYPDLTDNATLEAFGIVEDSDRDSFLENENTLIYIGEQYTNDHESHQYAFVKIMIPPGLGKGIVTPDSGSSEKISRDYVDDTDGYGKIYTLGAIASSPIEAFEEEIYVTNIAIVRDNVTGTFRRGPSVIQAELADVDYSLTPADFEYGSADVKITSFLKYDSTSREFTVSVQFDETPPESWSHLKDPNGDYYSPSDSYPLILRVEFTKAPKNTKLQNLILDGQFYNGPNYEEDNYLGASHGILTRKCNDLYLENCIIRNFANDGVSMKSYFDSWQPLISQTLAVKAFVTDRTRLYNCGVTLLDVEPNYLSLTDTYFTSHQGSLLRTGSRAYGQSIQRVSIDRCEFVYSPAFGVSPLDTKSFILPQYVMRFRTFGAGRISSLNVKDTSVQCPEVTSYFNFLFALNCQVTNMNILGCNFTGMTQLFALSRLDSPCFVTLKNCNIRISQITDDDADIGLIRFATESQFQPHSFIFENCTFDVSKEDTRSALVNFIGISEGPYYYNTNIIIRDSTVNEYTTAGGKYSYSFIEDWKIRADDTWASRKDTVFRSHSETVYETVTSTSGEDTYTIRVPPLPDHTSVSFLIRTTFQEPRKGREQSSSSEFQNIEGMIIRDDRSTFDRYRIIITNVERSGGLSAPTEDLRVNLVWSSDTNSHSLLPRPDKEESKYLELLVYANFDSDGTGYSAISRCDFKYGWAYTGHELMGTDLQRDGETYIVSKTESGNWGQATAKSQNDQYFVTLNPDGLTCTVHQLNSDNFRYTEVGEITLNEAVPNTRGIYSGGLAISNDGDLVIACTGGLEDAGYAQIEVWRNIDDVWTNTQTLPSSDSTQIFDVTLSEDNGLWTLLERSTGERLTYNAYNTETNLYDPIFTGPTEYLIPEISGDNRKFTKGLSVANNRQVAFLKINNTNDGIAEVFLVNADIAGVDAESVIRLPITTTLGGSSYVPSTGRHEHFSGVVVSAGAKYVACAVSRSGGSILLNVWESGDPYSQIFVDVYEPTGNGDAGGALRFIELVDDMILIGSRAPNTNVIVRGYRISGSTVTHEFDRIVNGSITYRSGFGRKVGNDYLSYLLDTATNNMLITRFGGIHSSSIEVSTSTSGTITASNWASTLELTNAMTGSLTINPPPFAKDGQEFTVDFKAGSDGNNVTVGGLSATTYGIETVTVTYDSSTRTWT